MCNSSGSSVLIFVLLLTLQSCKSHVTEVRGSSERDELIALLQEEAKVGSGVQSQNSSIRLYQSKRVRQYIERGQAMLPVALSVLEDDSISFDLWVRVYDVASSITYNLTGERLFWNGGITTNGSKEPANFKFIGPGPGIEDEFQLRHVVVADLKAKMLRLKQF